MRAGAASVEISIYEEIGFFGVTAQSFLEELKAVGARPIVLRINSPGGSIFEGLAIYNRLREHAPGVTVKVDGVAASMASVIAMAGKTIEMADNALLMIHNPEGLVAGGADDMRELADVLDKLRDSIVGAYEQRTGMARDKIQEMMAAETWMNADEAVTFGFADVVTPALKAAACMGLERFSHAPTAVLARRGEVQPPAAPEPAARAQIAELTMQRDNFRAEAEKHQAETVRQSTLIARLEGLAGVRGITRSDAVPVVAEPESAGGHVFDQWQEAKASGDWIRKSQLWSKHRDEIRAESQRRAPRR